MKRAMIAAAAVILTTPFAMAGPIDSACVKSDRGARARALCGCVQQVADMTLSRADQRRAAHFFTEPHKAQEVRMSKSDTDSAFWNRYRNFVSSAETYCAR